MKWDMLDGELLEELGELEKLSPSEFIHFNTLSNRLSCKKNANLSIGQSIQSPTAIWTMGI